MTPLSDGERRALALLAALLLLASAARWLERPRSILDDIPDVDVAVLADASEDAKQARQSRSGASRKPAADRPSQQPAARIDPNQATAEALARLPGVGPALAARIVAHRERAPFTTLDDLRNVPGIGPALAQRLADHVTLPPGTPSRAARASTPALAPAPARDPERSAQAPIDLNAATAEQLQTISGVGPAIATRLIARRDSLHGFRSFDDVDAVPGVGPALLGRIKAATIIRH